MAKENTQVQDVSTSSLQDFNWDESEDFFGIPSEEKSETDEVIATVKTDDVNDEPVVTDGDDDGDDTNPEADKSKKSKKKDEEEETPPTFFGEQPEDKSDSDEGKPSDTEAVPDDSKFYSTLATEMKEKGIFQNLELEEGEEIDEEKFFELQDAEIESRVEETFEAFGEDLDEDGKAFLKFKKNGGNTQDFFRVYGNQTSLSLDSVDTSNEEDQDLVIKHYLKVIDSMDDDEIADRLDWLEENGKKKGYAEKYMNKLQEVDKKNKEALAKQAENISKQREEGAKKFNQDLQTELEKTETVGSFDFSKVDKKDLINYITKPTVKIGKNKYITQFQAELGDIFKAEGDKKQSLLLLAKLVKTGFDVKDLLETTKTKVVKEAKSKLQYAKAGVRASSTGGSNRKAITDYF